MSYDPRAPSGASGSYGPADQFRKGSVRAARERLQQGQSSQILEPNSQLQQLPQSQYSQPNAPAIPQPTQTPQQSVSEYDNFQNESPISTQQWPLPITSAPESRRVPPQRPARGPDVPPMPANFYENSQNTISSGTLPRVGQGMS
jgi:hypothetical protein